MGMIETPMAVALRAMLAAEAVAVIGASGDPRKIGGRPIEYLNRFGFAGSIIPVNPGRPEVQGRRAYPAIGDAPPVELAIIATPGDMVETAMAQCAAAGVRAAVTFSAGFAEAGGEGERAQEQLAAIARDAGMAMLGPNCLGAIDAARGLTATFTTALEQGDLPAGDFSFVGQSGALGAYWLDLVRAAGMGVGKWITTGNEAMIGLADALAVVADDDETRIIGAYMEQIRDPEAFRAAALRAVARGKTILALPAGMSPAGQAAATAHTASRGEDPDARRCFMAECGLVEVPSLGDMIATARLIAAGLPVTRSRRIGVVTVSGGAGVLVCDAAARFGLEIAEVGKATAERLRVILPGFAQPRNPVDVTGAVLSDPGLLPDSLAALAEDGGCDAILVFIGAMSDIAPRLTQAIVEARERRVPLAVVWIGVPDAARIALGEAGIPVFDDIPVAVAAIARLRDIPSGR